MVSFKSDIISINGAVISSIGGRSENQDDFCFSDTPLGFLLVICDGMGGGPGGKTASYIVKCEIAKAILNCNGTVSRQHAFRMAVSQAHDMLQRQMDANPVLVGMGSTFVAILINGNSAVIAHAGDSRCYQMRGKKCIYQSNDHSLVAELVRNKALTEEEARNSPQSNIITRGLGSVSNNVPELDEVPFRKGDRFVLCTDGIWGMMPARELKEWFLRYETPVRTVESLDAETDRLGHIKGGKHDNHTLAVIDVSTDSTLPVKNGFQIFNLDKKKTYIIVGILIVAVILTIAITLVLKKISKETSHTSKADNPEKSSFSGYLANNGSDKITTDTSLVIPVSIETKSLIVDSLREGIKNDAVVDSAKRGIQTSNVTTPLQSIDSLTASLKRLHDFSCPASKKEKEATPMRNQLVETMHLNLNKLKESYKDAHLNLPAVVSSIENNLDDAGKIKYTLSKDDKYYELTPKIKEKIKGYISGLEKEKQTQETKTINEIQ